MALRSECHRGLRKGVGGQYRQQAENATHALIFVMTRRPLHGSAAIGMLRLARTTPAD
jgi:hypothetical protein